MRVVRALPVLAIVAFAVSGCAVNTAPEQIVPSGPTVKLATRSVAAPAQIQLSASQVAKTIAAKVPDMKASTIFTAATDPNKRLGRPGGYTSKVDFTDARVTDAKTGKGVDLGGSIEVFPTTGEAQKRSDYIQGILQGAPMFGTEYHYLSGGALVRVTGTLTPDQAAEYEDATSDR